MKAEERTACPAPRSAERRTHPRHEVDEGATLLLLSQGAHVPCRVTDLSLEGCRLRTETPFLAGIRIRVEVTFNIRGFAFRFNGVTQWTFGKQVVGVLFTGVPLRRRDELAEVLSEVEAEKSAKAGKTPAGQIAAQAQADIPVPIQGKENQHPAPARLAQPGQPVVPVPQPVPGEFPISRPLAGPLPKLEPIAKPPLLPRFEPIAQPQPLSKPQSLPAPRPVAQAPSVATTKPAGQPGRDRRAQSRQAVDTSAVIFLINIGSQVRGRIQDLSVGGCRIHTDERFPVGIYTRVETEFHLEGLPFRLGGVIQAIHDQGRQLVGIRFLDMSSRKREQVEQLIEEIEEIRATKRAARPVDAGEAARGA
jgi:hypothetical protein